LQISQEPKYTFPVPIKIEIPDSVAEAVRLPRQEIEAEVKKELALALYSRGALSEGKSAELAGLGRVEFTFLLAERKIPRNYSEGDLEHDLKWATKQA
jgi:predicted HTH domain antitoxin